MVFELVHAMCENVKLLTHSEVVYLLRQSDINQRCVVCIHRGLC